MQFKIRIHGATGEFPPDLASKYQVEVTGDRDGVAKIISVAEDGSSYTVLVDDGEDDD